MPDSSRKPRAIRLEVDPDAPAGTKSPAKGKKEAPSRRPRAMGDVAHIESIPDEAANGWIEDLTPPPPPRPPRRAMSWGKLLLAGLGGLVSLAIALAVDRLIRDLFARSEWLGWSAAMLAAMIVVALFAIAVREVFGLVRLRTIARLRERAASAHAEDNARLARAVVDELVSLYANRPDTARGRRHLAEHAGEIIDGSDLIALAERDLLRPLDKRATTMVMNAAKRVSVVTAVSPRALIDIGYVLTENMRLIRRLSDHYGGRPGTLGFLRLARDVLAHLAATGAIALGDSLIQQIVGHGLAARLSAKLGEGVVNGLLTARIGIAAIDVCRPLPFQAEKRPGVSDFLSGLIRLSGQGTAGGAAATAGNDPKKPPKT